MGIIDNKKQQNYFFAVFLFSILAEMRVSFGIKTIFHSSFSI
jgi:hypothetical protein